MKEKIHKGANVAAAASFLVGAVLFNSSEKADDQAHHLEGGAAVYQELENEANAVKLETQAAQQRQESESDLNSALIAFTISLGAAGVSLTTRK